MSITTADDDNEPPTVDVVLDIPSSAVDRLAAGETVTLTVDDPESVVLPDTYQIRPNNDSE